jgi:hypothetical protein
MPGWGGTCLPADLPGRFFTSIRFWVASLLLFNKTQQLGSFVAKADQFLVLGAFFSIHLTAWS